MGKYYDGYRVLHDRVKNACDCIKSHPCNNLYNEVNTGLDSVKAASRDLLMAGLGSSYNASLDSIINDFNTIIEAIEGPFAMSEDMYKTLNILLEDLKALDVSYTNLINLEPQKDDYEVSEEDENGKRVVSYPGFEHDYDIWQGKVHKLEEKIKETIETIEKLLTFLEEINGFNFTEEAMNTIHKMNFNYDKITDDILIDFDYNYYLAKSYYDDVILPKVDVSLLGYTEEDVINGLMDGTISKKKVKSILKDCPSNFNELMYETSVFDGDVNLYRLNGNNFVYDNYDIKTGVVSIGNNDFEIVEVYDKDKLSFEYNLAKKNVRALVINDIANYPPELLKMVSMSNADGTPQRIVLTDSVNLTTSMKANGLYTSKGTILVNASGNLPNRTLHYLNHELGHKFDQFAVDENFGGATLTGENTEKIWNIFSSEYDVVLKSNREISNHYNPYINNGEVNQNAGVKNKENAISEMFAETTDFFMRYPDEMREFAPKLYEFYCETFKIDKNNFSWEKSKIVVDGKTVNHDTAITDTLILSHR